MTSQILKMSLTLDNDTIKPIHVRLEFIEEQNKSLMLKDDMFEWYNSIVEIGYEHYLIGLAYSSDSVIVQDWNVRKRIEDVGGGTKFFTELMPFFNIDNFPFVIQKGMNGINLVNVKSGTTQTLIKEMTNFQIEAGFCLPMLDQEFEFHFTGL